MNYLEEEEKNNQLWRVSDNEPNSTGPITSRPVQKQQNKTETRHDGEWNPVMEFKILGFPARVSGECDRSTQPIPEM